MVIDDDEFIVLQDNRSDPGTKMEENDCPNCRDGIDGCKKKCETCDCKKKLNFS